MSFDKSVQRPALVLLGIKQLAQNNFLDSCHTDTKQNMDITNKWVVILYFSYITCKDKYFFFRI